MRCIRILNDSLERGFGHVSPGLDVLAIGTTTFSVRDVPADGHILHATPVWPPRHENIIGEHESIQLHCSEIDETAHDTLLVFCSQTSGRVEPTEMPLILRKCAYRGILGMPLKTAGTACNLHRGMLYTANMLTFMCPGDELYVYNGHPTIHGKPRRVFTYNEVAAAWHSVNSKAA